VTVLAPFIVCTTIPQNKSEIEKSVVVISIGGEDHDHDYTVRVREVVIHDDSIEVPERAPFLTKARQLENDMKNLIQVRPKSLPTYEDDAKLVLAEPVKGIPRAPVSPVPPRNQPPRGAKSKSKVTSDLTESPRALKSHKKKKKKKSEKKGDVPILRNNSTVVGEKQVASPIGAGGEKRKRGELPDLNFGALAPQKKKTLVHNLDKSREKYQQREMDNLRDYTMETADILKEALDS
jgi:hypothetical protein